MKSWEVCLHKLRPVKSNGKFRPTRCIAAGGEMEFRTAQPVNPLKERHFY